MSDLKIILFEQIEEEVNFSPTDNHGQYDMNLNRIFPIIFKKLGYDFNKCKVIGNGSYGIVFRSDVDGNVIKFTGQKSDAEISHRLINSPLDEFTCKIFKVFKLQTAKFHDIISMNQYFPYVIIKEYINPLPFEFNYSFNRLNKVIIWSDTLEYGILDDGFYEACKENNIKKEVVDWYVRFFEVMKKNNIWIMDFHAQNVGVKQDGNFALFDIGWAEKGGMELNQNHNLKVAENNQITEIEIPKYYKYKENFIQKTFRKLNLDYSKAKFLGDGNFGVAFKYENNTIKFTDQRNDAEMCHKLTNKQLKTICNVYAVYHLKSEEFITFDYAIIKEYVYPLSKPEHDEFEKAYYVYVDVKSYLGSGNADYFTYGLNKFFEGCKSYHIDIKIANFYIEAIQEMKENHIWITDLHEQNIGKRKNGDYVLFDLGQNNGGAELNPNQSLEVAEAVQSVT